MHHTKLGTCPERKANWDMRSAEKVLHESMTRPGKLKAMSTTLFTNKALEEEQALAARARAARLSSLPGRS